MTILFATSSSRLPLLSLLLLANVLSFASAQTAAPANWNTAVVNVNTNEDALQIYHLPYNRSLPQNVTLRASVLTNTVPLAWYDENITDHSIPFAHYRGFQPDFMRALIPIAAALDNVTLTFELQEAFPPFSYGKQFEYVANDCNSTTNRRGGFPFEKCQEYDLVVGDYYGYPSRSIRTLLTPPLLRTAGATVQYTKRKSRGRPITTLQEAVAHQTPVCLLDYSFYDSRTVERFPGLLIERCYNHTSCLEWLKADRCALFVEDELQLRYLAVQDDELQVTPERFDEQYILWPLNARLDPFLQQLFIRWIYQAKITGVLDDLYDDYFSVDYCPLGSAGANCTQPCSSAHGSADRYGNCVCESTKWTGDDCSTEVQEELNLIPTSLKVISFFMVAMNFTMVALCALWLFLNRNTTQVKVSQPVFLGLILLGCLISTSTIFALAAEDEGEGPVPGCMAIPWLYSVGFSITFGSLFAKIRRVFTLFRAAEKAAEEFETTPIPLSAMETFLIVTAILALDVTILLTWTITDPLQWHREITVTDKFGAPLASEGYCTSNHWIAFGGCIAALHLALMLLATYMCYATRNIPTQFHEGRYLSIAMVSNLQIFVIGLPVLVILGADPVSSFFVRSAIIWMNDLVVVTVIFGNIMYSHHVEAKLERERKSDELGKIAMQNYQAKQESNVLVSNMLLQS